MNPVRGIVATVLLMLPFATPAEALRSSTASFRSDRESAKVYLDGEYVGATPLDLDFACDSVVDRRYRFEHPGCAPAEGTLSARVAPGRVVGAAFSLGISLIFQCPRYFEEVHVELHCQDDGVDASAPVPAGLKVLKDLRERGVLSEEEYQQERDRLLRTLGY